MKKILWMVVAAIMTIMSAQAQNTKQEVAVSLGAWSNSEIINAFETIGSAMVGVKTDDGDFFGPISVEYFYHVQPWLGVGAIAAYGQMTQNFYLTSKSNGRDGEFKNNYLTLMPAVKFDWLRKSHFGMYSKLAFGATLRHEKIDYDDNSSYDDHNDSELHVNWQLSFLGIEAGGERLRGFMELGNGEQGIALVGVRYKF